MEQKNNISPEREDIQLKIVTAIGIIFCALFSFFGLFGLLLFPVKSQERECFSHGWTIMFIIYACVLVLVSILLSILFFSVFIKI